MKAAQDIILTPVITERSVDDMAESKYTFKVAKDANKVEIAKAAEELFQVQVLKVNTVNCTGHTKRMGRSVGKRPDFKKAVITINPEPTPDKDGMNATVLTLEYDPNRSAFIALVQYEDGEKRYILAADGLKVGDTVRSGSDADIKPGNALKLVDIPVGTFIHAIELYPGKGAQLVRSAGNMAQLMGKEGAFALVRLPSGEMRKVPIECRASIGQVSNVDHENVHYGKAGRMRNKGWRPTVRGSVMNPNDHPHGGGEGKSPIGRPGPVTPWGKPALGYKTRAKHKASDKYIVKRRNGR